MQKRSFHYTYFRLETIVLGLLILALAGGCLWLAIGLNFNEANSKKAILTLETSTTSRKYKAINGGMTMEYTYQINGIRYTGTKVEGLFGLETDSKVCANPNQPDFSMLVESTQVCGK
jgi:hypothetical protein